MNCPNTHSAFGRSFGQTTCPIDASALREKSFGQRRTIDPKAFGSQSCNAFGGLLPMNFPFPGRTRHSGTTSR